MGKVNIVEVPFKLAPTSKIYYYGKGSGYCTGISLSQRNNYSIAMCPINSKKKAGNVAIIIPMEDIPALVDGLTKSYYACLNNDKQNLQNP